VTTFFEEHGIESRHYVITRNPLDRPGKFVVREWLLQSEPVPLSIVAICDSLEEARKAIPEGMFRCGRHPGDAEVIVETWL
jgi:hypothetical protein